MILLSLNCNTCDSAWVEAVVAVGRWTSFPCLFCGSADVDHHDHDRLVERQAAA